MSSCTFIGSGNIAQALMGGLLKSQPAAKITASDPNTAQLERLAPVIKRCHDNNEAIQGVDVVVLCLKPKLMAEVCQNLNSQNGQQLFVSVAAGITMNSLSAWLGEDTAIIRCMPNTPALVQQGMTGLYANAKVSQKQKLEAEEILASVGQIHWFDEEAELDVVTAISGSGPAYYFLFMEAMQEAGESLGLSPEVARKLVLQTAVGAAQMAQESKLSAEQLRINVTSPGGTTEAAITTMIKAGIKDILGEAIDAAHKKSKALSEG